MSTGWLREIAAEELNDVRGEASALARVFDVRQGNPMTQTRSVGTLIMFVAWWTVYVLGWWTGASYPPYFWHIGAVIMGIIFKMWGMERGYDLGGEIPTEIPMGGKDDDSEK